MQPSTSLDIAVIQATSIDDVEANWQHLKAALKSLESKPPDLICLPENSLYMKIGEKDRVQGLELSHPVFSQIQEWARQFQVTFHLGAVPLKMKNDRGEERIFNCSLWLNPSGGIQPVYQKIHLFDVDFGNGRQVMESAVFEGGARISHGLFRDWRLGFSICYDLRFADMYLPLYRIPTDLIFIPSAFLVNTGEAHWQTLVRARAIEGQCYIIAAAQGGTHRNAKGDSRGTWGESLVVDPWGRVVARGPNFHEGSADGWPVLRCTIHPETLHEFRRQVPVCSHRRSSDFYQNLIDLGTL